MEETLEIHILEKILGGTKIDGSRELKQRKSDSWFPGSLRNGTQEKKKTSEHGSFSL
jgi:hypothetical protein